MPTQQLVANSPLTSTLRLLQFASPAEGHHFPGQYITLQLESQKPGYFALVNQPHQPIRLLIKQEGALGSAIASLQEGQEVELSNAMGAGFSLEKSAGKDLVILCNGSGISACHPVIQHELQQGLSRSVHLYYGIRSALDRCFTEDINRWQDAGVKVETVISQPDPSWTGARGYVQDLARAQGYLRHDIALLLVGTPTMQKQAKEMWSDAGLPPDLILTNF